MSSMDTTKASSMEVEPAIKSPWSKTTGGIGSSMEINFQDIMSEQLAEGLQNEEAEKYYKDIIESTNPKIQLEKLIGAEYNDCSSDEAIAAMLQLQFNKEHDQDLRKLEQKYNGTSKVSVSLSNYMTVSPGCDSDTDDDEEEEEDRRKSWDSFESHERAFPIMGNRGYAKINNEVITKHDVIMNGRRNACRVMEHFPPCIQTGDASSFDMQISNKIYNKLRNYSIAEDKRRTRLHDKEEKATSDLAIDKKTRLLLYKWINADILKEVHGVISTGKESVILYAEGGGIVEVESGDVLEIPDETVVKVFKTTLNEFKTRDKYIRDDYRFKDRFSKQNPRKIIHLWAEKELHNLTRMAKAGLPCPKVILLKKHLLLLSFVGKDGKPAPKLKEVNFPSDDNELLRKAYDQVISGMCKLFQECKLVHSDLSEYNILWHENICFFIDVSQSVEPSHPNALEFLYRDCHNIITFFTKRGLENIHSPASLFTFVSGIDISDESSGLDPSTISQIKNFEKNIELCTLDQSTKAFPFDIVWDKVHH